MTGRIQFGLVLALLASLAGNLVQGWAYLAQRDRATVATSEAQHHEQRSAGAQAVAKACSDGVGAVAAATIAQQTRAAPALAAAAAHAQVLNKRADSTLATAPGLDACADMQAMGDEWLQGREIQ
ncbi:hypothetical protein [Comamonas testosteroni]|uniref:hypothetical protein n=1 Tax=Comamonas testosteroni TaxID=285 RepID=UPI002E0ECBA6|nr:hypothetical protein U0024_21825 [Comamonas testosteroni]